MTRDTERPKEIEVAVRAGRPRRGEGVRVQITLTRDEHHRLLCEVLRQRRQGRPATVESVMRACFVRHLDEFPRGIE